MDWSAGKPVTLSVVTASSSGTADFTVQFTLNDVTSSAGANPYTSTGAATQSVPVWQNATVAGPFGFPGLSSAFTSSGGYPSLHFELSVIDTAAGLTFVTLGPVAGVRLNSTALSSTILTLTLLQGIGF